MTSALRLIIAHEKRSETRPKSIEQYIENIRPFLEANDVEILDQEFGDKPVTDRFNLIWAPGLGNRRVPPAVLEAPRKSVVTLHGINSLFDPLTIGKTGLRKGIGNFLWRKRIQRDWSCINQSILGVIAVSDISKVQLSQKLKLSIDLITRIYNGVEDSFLEINAENPGHYILHVSQYSHVKNIPRMFDAHRIFSPGHDMPLHVVSAGAPEMEVPQGCILFRNPAPRDAIAGLLRQAHVMFMPSLEETFCLPVLEAMAAGVPVVTSRGTGAAEVAGGAAVLVDPFDVNSMAEGLTRAVTDQELRADLIARGRARAATFSWRRSAQEHLTLFRKLAARG